MAKTYIGRRDDDNNALEVTVKHETGRTQDLNPRYDLRNHSPTGFECGYNGSGPAQLALAICADALGDDNKALAAYQRFKFKIVAGLSHTEGWELSEIIVLETIRGFSEAEAVSAD